jgi:hypothetical protein
MVYGILIQQQTITDEIGPGEIPGNVLNMPVVGQASPHSTPATVQAQISENKPMAQPLTQIITKPTKLLPRTARLDRQGFSAQLVALPKDEGTTYRAAVHISLFGRMYSVQLQLTCPGFSFDRGLHVRNIVPDDFDMAVACRTGDFDRARKLLASGLAQGSDITASGWPMLEVSVHQSLRIECSVVLT